MFHQFFGENMLRADVCNSVDELGQLLDHTGPVAASRAQRGAHLQRRPLLLRHQRHLDRRTRWCGTHTVAPGDVVVVDRNCHKSILHAIIMTGAIPVFLTPTRNHFGIIGPIPLERVRAGRASRRRSRANPLLAGVDAEDVKPRILTLTQSTYDGVLYNAETIKHMLDGYDRHAALRRGVAAARGLPRLLRRHARDRQGPAAPEGRADLRDAVDAQAARRLSQASQILVQDSQNAQARPRTSSTRRT